MTYSTEDGLTLDVSETGQSHSTLNSESSSTFNLSNETTHADQTITNALYQDQSTLAYSANANEQYTRQSHRSISSDDELTTSGTLVESGDGTSSGTAAITGSHETSTIQPATDPNGSPLVLQTSNDIWTDQLTFDDLYEFDMTKILSEDGSFIVNLQQSGSGASAFDHIGSGASDDADEATPTETYEHHIWEYTDYSYAKSATIASIPDDGESTISESTEPQGLDGNTDGSGNTLVSPFAQVTNFDYVLTTHKVGGADVNGTSEFAKLLIGTLPDSEADSLANGSATADTSWDATSNKQQGYRSNDGDETSSETPWTDVFWEEGMLAINIPWRWVIEPAYSRADQTAETFRNDGFFAGYIDMSSALLVDFNPAVNMFRGPFDAINYGTQEFERTGTLSGVWWGFHKGLPGGESAHGFFDAVWEQKVHVGPDAGRELTRNEIVRNIITPGCDAAATLALWGLAKANTPKGGSAPRITGPGKYVPNTVLEHLGRGYGRALEHGKIVKEVVIDQKMYGPFFHSGKPGTIDKIVASSELWGKAPRNYFAGSPFARAKAHLKIPQEGTGVVFETRVKPDASSPGGQAWWTNPEPYAKWMKIAIKIIEVRK